MTTEIAVRSLTREISRLSDILEVFMVGQSRDVLAIMTYGDLYRSNAVQVLTCSDEEVEKLWDFLMGDCLENRLKELGLMSVRRREGVSILALKQLLGSEHANSSAISELGTVRLDLLTLWMAAHL